MQQEDDSDILDRINVRYDVRIKIEEGAQFSEDADCYYAMHAQIIMTCGVYSGVPTKEMMADLINSRGFYEEDIVELQTTGKQTRKELAEIVARRKLKPDDIAAMKILAVELDEAEIAASL